MLFSKMKSLMLTKWFCLKKTKTKYMVIKSPKPLASDYLTLSFKREMPSKCRAIFNF